jgi:hypothetical protein
MKLLSTFPDAFYDIVVGLEGVNYRLQFNYNQRENVYYMSVATADGLDIVNGIKVVCNWPLLHKYADNRLPPGEIFAFANTQDQSPPGLAALGTGLHATLYYISRDEMIALGF